jgi:hypothetical protein
MKRKIFIFFAVVILSLLVVPPSLVKVVRADSTDSVAATVTAQIFSVSLDNGDGIAFGTIATSSAQDTTTSGVNDSTTATNDGSVAAKFNIQSTDSTGGAGWTLGAAASSETYTMKFCVTTCDSSPAWNSVGIDPAYQTLAASVAKDGTQVFDLQVGTPTSTVVTAEQSVTVTIQAVTPD